VHVDPNAGKYKDGDIFSMVSEPTLATTGMVALSA